LGLVIDVAFGSPTENPGARVDFDGDAYIGRTKYWTRLGRPFAALSPVARKVAPSHSSHASLRDNPTAVVQIGNQFRFAPRADMRNAEVCSANITRSAITVLLKFERLGV
jgi:hypothetical protein